jgi:uncharacterized membrane protein
MLLIGIGGLIYLFRSQFMPYHAIAVGKTWAEVTPAFQILLLALMKTIGGAWIAMAVAIGIVLFIPFRQGMHWARWAIPVVGFVALLPTVYATLSLVPITPTTPPWKGILLIMALLIAGFILSLERKRAK